MSITDKEAFKTMKEPSAGALEKLRGWKPPNRAYILFEIERFDIRTQTPVMDLWTLNAEDRPEIGQKIHDAVLSKRKARVLHYGNFPSLNDRNPYRAAHAKKHSGPMGENPWDDLERICLHYMNGALSTEAKDQISELEKKLAEANQKLESQTKKVVNERPSKA